MSGGSTTVDRRAFVVLGLAGPAIAAMGTTAPEPTEQLHLWPGAPPGAPTPLPYQRIVERASAGAPRDRIAVGTADPLLDVFTASAPNGRAVLLIPGGAFVRVALDKEGYETAGLLNRHGVTAFVLRYRLPGDGWAERSSVPLQDAQRAMRIIRANARRLGFDRSRVGVVGFSAGGHVAASLAGRHDQVTYKPVDRLDSGSSRPDALGLIYPVISLGRAAHAGTRDELLGSEAGRAAIDAGSPNLHVAVGHPATMLVHAADDATVSPSNSRMMYDALVAHHVPSELHIFETGGHGFGLRLPPDATTSLWPELLLKFLARHLTAARQEQSS